MVHINLYTHCVIERLEVDQECLPIGKHLLEKNQDGVRDSCHG